MVAYVVAIVLIAFLISLAFMGLAYWARKYGRRFVLVGTESEAAAGREVLAAMDEDVRGAAEALFRKSGGSGER